jgi:hypothetical protein
MQAKDLTIWILQALWGVVILCVGFIVKRLWSELDYTHDDVVDNANRINAMEVLIATLKANDVASSERMASLKEDFKELRKEFLDRMDHLNEKLDTLVNRQDKD